MAAASARDVQTLSGGERRVALAMLAQDPDVMLLDEPTSHLDVAHEVRTLELVAQHARDGRRAVVMALHDPVACCARHATHAILLADGEAATDPRASSSPRESASRRCSDRRSSWRIRGADRPSCPREEIGVRKLLVLQPPARCWQVDCRHQYYSSDPNFPDPNFLFPPRARPVEVRAQRRDAV